jgi:hypothetical protein
MSRKLENILISKNVDYEVMSLNELKSHQKAWREIFAKPLYKKTGEWTKDNFDWHTFSFGYTPSFSGDLAWNKYRQAFKGIYLLLPNLEEGDGYKCNSEIPLNLSGKNIDVYICPLDYSWTFVNTHEEGMCGPYYCERSML